MRPWVFAEILVWFASADLENPAFVSDISYTGFGASLPEQQLRTDPLGSPIPSQSVPFTRHCKSFFFRPDQLQQRAHQYGDGQKELDPICEEIADRAGRPINPAKQTVVKYWADQGFQWHRPHGPPEKPAVPVV
jgi:hypothetical protein